MQTKLIDIKTNNEIKAGDTVTTFRGEKGKLISIEAPRHSGSTGRVYVQLGSRYAEFFPTVINAKIVEADDSCVDEPCPACHSHQYIALGFLGNREHRRCRACGLDYSLEVNL